VRCRPYSITYSGHPIGAHIGFDDLPSYVAGWWPNEGNLDSTTCAHTTLRLRKILHIYLPNGFSVSLHEPQLGMEKPKKWKPLTLTHRRPRRHRITQLLDHIREFGLAIPVASVRTQANQSRKRRFQLKRYAAFYDKRRHRRRWRAGRCRAGRGCQAQA